MSVSPPAQARGLMPSLVATTSTGAGTGFGVPPTQTVAMQVTAASTAAVGTDIQMEGSLDGSFWFNVGAAQTYTSTGVSVYVSTGVFVATSIRASVVVHTATGTIAASLVAV